MNIYGCTGLNNLHNKNPIVPDNSYIKFKSWSTNTCIELNLWKLSKEKNGLTNLLQNLAFINCYRYKNTNDMEIHIMKSYVPNKGYGSYLLANLYDVLKKRGVNRVYSTLYTDSSCSKEDYLKFLSKMGFKQSFFSRWFSSKHVVYADIPNEIGDKFSRETLEKYNLDIDPLLSISFNDQVSIEAVFTPKNT